jgi:lipoate-protein ligase A
MYQLRLTLPTPAENVALDEALLEAGEAGLLAGGVLRLWESPDYFVVLGRSSDPQIEVNRDACRRQGVPVLRRASGGGTVLAGPGCLMYAVVVDFRELPHLRAVDAAHRHVLERIAAALAPQVPGIAHAGISDLVLEAKNSPPLKISGNALRIKREHFLYHGTLLYNFDLDRIGQLLATPTRVPNYREQRNHDEFVANLPLSRDAIENALLQAWNATEPLTNWPSDRTAELAAAKYELIE